MHFGQLAIQAQREDRLKDALTYYRLYLGENPGSGEGWFGLGTLLHTKIGALERAIDCYRKAIDLMPSIWLPDLYLGMLYCEFDQPESAVVHLNKFVRANPDAGTVAYSDLACAYVRMGELDAAREVAAACRRQYPDDYFAPFLAAWVAATQGNLPEAIYHATDSAALDPMWPVPLGLKGLLLSQAGQLAESRRALQEMAMIQCAALMLAVPSKKVIAASRLWREIRHDAKRRLGIPEIESANFLILKGGLGDQFCMATQLAGFRAANKPLPLVVFSSPDAKWNSLFAESADLFLHLDTEQMSELELCNRFVPDQPYHFFFPWFRNLYSIAFPRQVVNFTLGLPWEHRGCGPTISDEVARKGLDLFHGLGGKPGRSVLVSPLSNSNAMVAQPWWQALVDELDRAGFVVFENMTNMSNPDRPPGLSRAIPVEMPLEQVIPFCEAAGFFVGIRSGLCDLLGYARARMKAIHVTRRDGKEERYPLSVWFGSDSNLSVRRQFESEYWEDVTIDVPFAFDPAIVADWIGMPALHA